MIVSTTYIDLNLTFIFCFTLISVFPLDQCLLELQDEARFMWSTDLDGVAPLGFKFPEGFNYDMCRFQF